HTGRLECALLARWHCLPQRLKALFRDVRRMDIEEARIRGSLSPVAMRRQPALVHARHGESRATGLAALANRLAVWRSGFLISVSEQASAISRAEGAPSERVRVIRNGIDLGRVRRLEQVDFRQPRVVAIGRLTPVKDLPTLLRAAQIAANVDWSFQLDVLG